MTYEEMFADVPTSGTLLRHQAKQDVRLLDAAASRIHSHGANPWVFSSDARHFWQFATVKDVLALDSLSIKEHIALLGAWADEEFWPESFNLPPPRARESQVGG